MGEPKPEGDKVADKPQEARGEKTTVAQQEAQSGMEKLSGDAKSYVQWRKNGGRDVDTKAHLPPPPEIIDSSLIANQMKAPTDSAAAGKVEMDSEHRVSKISYRDGSSTTVKYDDWHNPTKLTDSDKSYWQQNKEHSGWDHFDKHGKKDAHRDGDFEVNDKGDITLTESNGNREILHKDNSSEKYFADRSAVFTDGDGRVTQMRHKDGSYTVPEYAQGKDGKPALDKDGDPVPVKFTEYDANGVVKGSWAKDGDRWSIRDKDGKESHYFQGDVKVNSEGDVVRKGMFSDTNEAEARTYHRDGSVTRDLRDGSSVQTQEKKLTPDEEKQAEKFAQQYEKQGDSPDEAQRKAHEQIMDVRAGDLARGHQEELERQRQPLYEQNYKEEITAQREAQYREEYRKQLQDKLFGAPSYEEAKEQAAKMAHERVTSEAKEIEHEAAKKAQERIKAESADTHKESMRWAREQVDRDVQPIHVKYPNGKTADFKYDDQGKLSEFTDSKGIIHRNEHGTWQMYELDKTGKEVTRGAEEGNYQTKANGDLVWSSKDGKVTETTHASGTRDRLEWFDPTNHEKRDNIVKQTTWDDHGRLTSATYPGEKTSDNQVKYLGYDRNGKLDSIGDASASEPGMTSGHWSRQRDGSWTKYDENGKAVREARSVEVKPNGDIVVTNKDGKTDQPIQQKKF